MPTSYPSYEDLVAKAKSFGIDDPEGELGVSKPDAWPPDAGWARDVAAKVRGWLENNLPE